MGLGVIVGVIIGVVIGVTIDDIVMGIGIGLAMGIAMSLIKKGGKQAKARQFTCTFLPRMNGNGFQY